MIHLFGCQIQVSLCSVGELDWRRFNAISCVARGFVKVSEVGNVIREGQPVLLMKVRVIDLELRDTLHLGFQLLRERRSDGERMLWWRDAAVVRDSR